ncbi:MAG TPA: transposase [Myxococcota bacterium]|nr:transposase [Myxococcota bacterium]
MPRGPRLDSEGSLHHVMARGIEKRDIFRSDADRGDFMARIAVVGPATGTCIFAWSLIPNHFHLLLRSGPPGLSTFMRRLQTGYAVAYNRRHRRSGHLFQNRFKSILVEEEPYFLELVRYLHLNPLRAGLVKSLRGLDVFSWSGHAVILGNREAPWQDIGYVLQQFGGTSSRARQAYRRFVAEGIRQGRRPELSGGGLVRSIGGRDQLAAFRRGRERWASDERVLGSGEFVEQVREGVERSGDRRRVRPERQQEALEELVGQLSKRMDVEVGEVFGPSRRQEVSSVRAALCHFAVTRMGISLATVARFLGVSPPAVKQAMERGKDKVEGLGEKVERLVDKFI